MPSKKDPLEAPHAALATITKATVAPGWNTKNLAQRIGSDILAASLAGAIVAPIITIIDRAIIENASNRATLTTSMRRSLTTLALRPHKFLASRPFALIFLLYTGTYSSANLLDTASSTLHPTTLTPSSVTSGTAKFATTSATNLTLCLYKDSQFTKLFGSAGGASPVRMPTYALFAARDCLTIFASFNLPPILAPMLPLSAAVEEKVSRASVAQFIAPAALQVVSTPLHLLGLDVYNRPLGGSVEWRSRAAKVWQDWGKSVVARVCRIVPAFGVGGVVNMRARKGLMAGLE